MKRLFFTFLILAMPMLGFAQIETPIDDDFNIMIDKLDDVMNEMDGLFTLRFADAENDNPVVGASIDIKNIGKFSTNEDGFVRFPLQDDGKYYLKFEKEGYITANLTFEVIAGTIFFNRFSVSKVLDMGQVRIVLDWSSTPRDLDLHLEKVGNYHIAYNHMRVADDGTARLDRDDLDGNGPETITITDVDERATYNCYVKDFTNRSNSNSNDLSKSRARVTVYNNNILVKTYMVPANNEKGTRWDIFQLKQGNFIDINSLAN